MLCYAIVCHVKNAQLGEQVAKALNVLGQDALGSRSESQNLTIPDSSFTSPR